MPDAINRPKDAASLEDVRIAIDQIDRDIVYALARRMRYVERASEFKEREADISAPDRVVVMMHEREK